MFKIHCAQPRFTPPSRLVGRARKAALVVGLVLLAGAASAADIVYPGAACTSTKATTEKTNGELVNDVLSLNNESADFTCPIGLPYGSGLYVKVVVSGVVNWTANQSFCKLRLIGPTGGIVVTDEDDFPVGDNSGVQAVVGTATMKVPNVLGHVVHLRCQLKGNNPNTTPAKPYPRNSIIQYRVTHVNS
jgi:hypothetical protein